MHGTAALFIFTTLVQQREKERERGLKEKRDKYMYSEPM